MASSCIFASSTLRRPPLSKAGPLLTAGIYGKHFDLLEARGLVGRVEQANIRIKR